MQDQDEPELVVARRIDDPLRGRKSMLTDIDVAVRVYEDMVQGWFLDFGAFLSQEKNQLLRYDDKEFSTNEAGFVTLMVGVGYLEANQQYREGKKSTGCSEEYFLKAIKRLFDLSKSEEETVKKVYSELRCGLFHDGMTRSRVLLGDYSEPFHISGEMIKINPKKFFRTVQTDFNQYITDLKNENEKDKREAFLRRWKLSG